MPGTTSQSSSNAAAWPKFTQPASCAVCSALATSPAATKTSTIPVKRKKRVRLSLIAAAVDRDADRDGADDPEQRAQAGRRRVRRALEGGQQEDDGLEALADDGEEGHADERAGRPGRERALGARSQVLADRARVLAHPDDHERDRADGEQRDDRLQALLLALRQVLVDELERDAGGDADADRRGDADPHPLHRIAPAGVLAQERGDDPDDERRFDAFAETDHERRQHLATTSCIREPYLGHPKPYHRSRDAARLMYRAPVRRWTGGLRYGVRRSCAMPTRSENGLSKTPVAFIRRCTRCQSP